MGTFKVPLKELCGISVANADLTDNDLVDYIKQPLHNQNRIEKEIIDILKLKLMRYFIPTFKKNWKSSFYRNDIF